MKLLPLIVEIVMIFVLRFSVSICGYDRQCPHSSQRGFRIHSECSGNSSVYNCLYNEKNKTYTELCDTNEKARAGLKYVLSGTIRNVRCSEERYQPITFWSNRSTDCLYSKSQCTEIGQLVFDKTSTIADSNCRCDYTRHFAFVSLPRNPCFCTPSIEDCSCYLKHCPTDTTLSPDYECLLLNSTNRSFTCKHATHVYANGSDVATSLNDDEQYTVWKRSVPLDFTVIVLIVYIVITGFVMLRRRHTKMCGTGEKQISLTENYKKDIHIESEQNSFVAVNKTSVSSINNSNVDSQTIPMKASSNRQINIMQSLTANNHEINCTDKKGPRLYHRSSVDKNVGIVKKCDEHKYKNDGSTPLMAACQKGNISTVKFLIERGADINITDEEGRSAFFWSCVSGNIGILKLLINKKCDEHKYKNDGETPLIAACQKGNISTVKFLIDRGADINITDEEGRSPFFWSCVSGNIDILKLLINKKCDEHIYKNDGETPLIAACQKGNISTVKFLIDRGADINITDEEGRSPFFWSCVSGNIDVLNLLIDEKCDENIYKNDGSTPLMAARQKGNMSIAELLIERGADINITDKQGQTPY